MRVAIRDEAAHARIAQRASRRSRVRPRSPYAEMRAVCDCGVQSRTTGSRRSRRTCDAELLRASADGPRAASTAHERLALVGDERPQLAARARSPAVPIVIVRRPADPCCQARTRRSSRDIAALPPRGAVVRDHGSSADAATPRPGSVVRRRRRAASSGRHGRRDSATESQERAAIRVTLDERSDAAIIAAQRDTRCRAAQHVGRSARAVAARAQRFAFGLPEPSNTAPVGSWIRLKASPISRDGARHRLE